MLPPLYFSSSTGQYPCLLLLPVLFLIVFSELMYLENIGNAQQGIRIGQFFIFHVNIKKILTNLSKNWTLKVITIFGLKKVQIVQHIWSYDLVFSSPLFKKPHKELYILIGEMVSQLLSDNSPPWYPPLEINFWWFCHYSFLPYPIPTFALFVMFPLFAVHAKNVNWTKMFPRCQIWKIYFRTPYIRIIVLVSYLVYGPLLTVMHVSRRDKINP